MRDWAAENTRLRLDRDAMNDVKRREADTADEPTHGDCSCTAGHVCRQNSACPRLAASNPQERQMALLTGAEPRF